MLKAFADRPHDWGDIDGIVARQTVLDWDYIEIHLRPLVEIKEAPHILAQLSRVRRIQR